MSVWVSSEETLCCEEEFVYRSPCQCPSPNLHLVSYGKKSEGCASLGLIYATPPSRLNCFLKEVFIQLTHWRVKTTETHSIRVVMDVAKETAEGMLQCLVSPQIHRSVACLRFWCPLNSCHSCCVVRFPAGPELSNCQKCGLTKPALSGKVQFCIFILEEVKGKLKSYRALFYFIW